MSSVAVEPSHPEKPKRRATRSAGRRRKLVKRVVPKPDGRYLIFYRPPS